MDEKKQIQLEDINNILQVLQSIVNESFLSTSRSEKSPEEIKYEANVFPVISCFSSVIKFVSEGLINIPQGLVKQFLEVATILDIVKEEDVRHEDYEEDVRREDHEEDLRHEDYEDDLRHEDYEEDVGDEGHDEEINDNLWWDNGSHQYQLYWGDDDEGVDDDYVFLSDHTDAEDEDEYSIAHRVKTRRARLGATAAAEVVSTPPSCSATATSPPPIPRRSTEIKRDPLITALLRTISRTAPKAVFSSKRSEILKKERNDIKIADIVPEEFRKLWDTHDEEEEVKIIVPDPYPTIDWSKVNKRFVSNIPEPKAFPVQGCSQDPQFYEWSHKIETVHRCGDYLQARRCTWV